MAKYYGDIGYSVTEQTDLGVYETKVISRSHYGEVERSFREYNVSDLINDDFNVNNTLSIIADKFALENFHRIIYAEWFGVKWKVKSVEVQHPRLILSLGGVYNAE